MVMAFDLIERVPQTAEEVLVGRNNRAVHVELNHRLGFIHRLHLAFELGIAVLFLRHIGSERDDLRYFSSAVKNRVVGRLNPNFFAALTQPPVYARIVLALVKFLPEGMLFGRRRIGGIGEHPLMMTFDLVQRVAQKIQKVLIRSNDGSICIELDHALGSVQCRHLIFGLE